MTESEIVNHGRLTVSVGVPTLNHGQYLAQTLDSLLSQTVPPDEIVVSDNNSTDETPEVLRRYGGRVRVIRPPERLPMVAHFNFVVQNLSGDWFSVLGADDVAEPWFVEHLSRAAMRDRDAVLVRGGWRTISLSGRSIGVRRLWSTASLTRPPRTFLEQLPGPRQSLSATLGLRSAWLEAGGFPASLRHSFDWGLYLRLSAIGSSVTTRKIVSRVRTEYPDNKTIGRLIDKAHDERVIAVEIAPEVAETLGLSSGEAMRRAARRRLVGILAEAELTADAEIRARVAAELGPLAAMTDQGSLLSAFLAGKAIRQMPYPHRRAIQGARVIAAQSRTAADSFARFVRNV